LDEEQHQQVAGVILWPITVAEQLSELSVQPANQSQ